ncbi:MAG: tRNA wybutosine-synthesizing 3 family protein [Nanoarchaeota archaeon]
MPRDRFLQRKIAVLSKLDKSSIGKWDKKIKKLCDKINFLRDFYTTSSCSGRVILMIEQDKKGKDLFLKTWHDKINLSELKRVLNEISCSEQTSLSSSLNKKVKVLSSSNNVKCKVNKVIISPDNLIKFKVEPPIIHIVCRDLKDASVILEKAKYIGFKRSSILTCDKNTILELNSSDRIEFPIIKNGKILVADEFLKLIVKISNEKLEKGWEKIRKLEKIV